MQVYQTVYRITALLNSRCRSTAQEDLELHKVIWMPTPCMNDSLHKLTFTNKGTNFPTEVFLMWFTTDIKHVDFPDAVEKSTVTPHYSAKTMGKILQTHSNLQV